MGEISPKCGWVVWLIPKQGSKPSKKTKSPQKSLFSTQISPFVFPNLTKNPRDGWVGKQIWERYPKKKRFFYTFPYTKFSRGSLRPEILLICGRLIISLPPMQSRPPWLNCRSWQQSDRLIGTNFGFFTGFYYEHILHAHCTSPLKSNHGAGLWKGQRYQRGSNI